MKVLKIKFGCAECDAQYSLEYDDDTFIRPEYCPFCSNSTIEEIEQ